MDSYLDLFINNSQQYLIEKFEEDDLLVFANDPDASKDLAWANGKETATPPEMPVIVRGSAANTTYVPELGSHSFNGSDTKPSLNIQFSSSTGVGGTELALHNKISSKGAGLAFRYDISTDGTSANQHIYIAVKNFTDTYNGTGNLLITPLFLNIASEVSQPYNKIDTAFSGTTGKDYILAQSPIESNATLNNTVKAIIKTQQAP